MFAVGSYYEAVMTDLHAQTIKPFLCWNKPCLTFVFSWNSVLCLMWLTYAETSLHLWWSILFKTSIATIMIQWKHIYWLCLNPCWIIIFNPSPILVNHKSIYIEECRLLCQNNIFKWSYLKTYYVIKLNTLISCRNPYKSLCKIN